MPSITALSPHHDRKSFDCGKPALNDFLLFHGLSKYTAKVYVLVPDIASAEILAYFALTPDPQALTAANRVLWRYVEVNYLAVDKRYQRQGIGEELLVEIMTQVVEAAEANAIEGMALTPLDDEAERWYLNRGFGFQVTFMPDRMLILFLDSMKSALKGRA